MASRRTLTALAVLLLAGGAAAAQPAPAPACQVTWLGMTHFTYDEDRLSAVILRGRQSLAPDKDFGVTDDDGFLTIAALLNQWQSDGRAAQNATGRVTLRRNELELALQAAKIGLAYQAYVLRDQGGTAVGDDDADGKDALARQEYWRVTVAELRRLLGIASANGVTVAKGFIRARFGDELERFAPNDPKRLGVVYFDYDDADNPSEFCQPGQKNRLVGEVLCSRNFATGAERAGTPCAGGVAMNELAALPVCRGVVEDKALVDRDCLPVGAVPPAA